MGITQRWQKCHKFTSSNQPPLYQIFEVSVLLQTREDGWSLPENNVEYFSVSYESPHPWIIWDGTNSRSFCMCYYLSPVPAKHSSDSVIQSWLSCDGPEAECWSVNVVRCIFMWLLRTHSIPAAFQLNQAVLISVSSRCLSVSLIWHRNRRLSSIPFCVCEDKS